MHDLFKLLNYNVVETRILILLLSLTTFTQNLFAQLEGGAYTIGGANSDYQTITAAANDLNEFGIAGSVVFEIESGLYDEQVNLINIQGTNETNIITFKSKTGVAEDVVLRKDDSDYVLLIEGCNYINLKYITFEKNGGAAVGGSNSYDLLRIRATTNGLKINGCIFNGNNINAEPINHAGIDYRVIDPYTETPYWGNQTISNDLDITNNVFNCYTPIYIYFGEADRRIFEYTDYPYSSKLVNLNIIDNKLYNSNPSKNFNMITCVGIENLNISNNEICDKTGNLGIGVWHSQKVNIINNTIEVEGRGSYIENVAGVNIDKNKINSAYGLKLNYIISYEGRFGLFGDFFRSHLVNNIIISKQNGIYFNDVLDIDVYYNNVLSKGTIESAAFLNYNQNYNSLDCQLNCRSLIQNNIFFNSGDGYAIKESGSYSSDIIYDHNAYYSSGNKLFSIAANEEVDNLADWQNILGNDENSIIVNPYFNDSLRAGNPLLFGTGNEITGINDDIEGNTRTTQPTIGAHENLRNLGDVTPVELISPQIPFAIGENEVTVKLLNSGNETINSDMLYWEVNGELQPPVSWEGNLMTGKDTIINLGSYLFNQLESYNIKIWSNIPNSQQDISFENDTLFINNFYTALGGSYTIGIGSTTDFKSINEAVSVLQNGGVLDEVIFSLVDAEYVEQFELNYILGSSKNNRITFQSSLENSKILHYNINNADNVVVLNNASHLSFDNIVFEAENEEFSRLINLEGDLTDLEFTNCKFLSKNNNSCVSAENINFSNLKFIGNYFSKSNYGIYLKSISYADSILIENNIFEDQIFASNFLNNLNSPVIKNNEIKCNEDFVSVGIEMNNCVNDFEVINNKVNLLGGKIGIFLNECGGNPDKRGLLANNFVVVGGSDESNSWGIPTNSSYIDIVYNSILAISNVEKNSYGVLVYGGNNQKIINNNIVNKGIGIAFYVQEPENISQSDFNNIYSDDLIGFWNDNTISSIAEWQEITGLGSNSLSVQPIYASDADLHTSQILLDKAGAPLEYVKYDIDGELRDLTDPDIGADEFTTFENDLKLTRIVNLESGCEKTENKSLIIEVANFGLQTQSNFALKATINDTLTFNETYSGILNSKDTLVYTFSQSIDFITSGSYMVKVKVELINEEYEDDNLLEKTIEIINAEEVTPVNLLPIDNQQEVDYPIKLSWSPSNVDLTYEVYIWKNNETQPTNPNIQVTNRFFVFLSNNPQLYQPGGTYNWLVTSKTTLCEFSSPIQSFTIRNFPDLVVQNIQIPTMPLSGQNIQVDWEVHNISTGDTEDETWYDRVYLSNSQNINAGAVYLGAASNTTALNAGESYSNSIIAAIPQGYDGDYYIIIQTDAYSYIDEVVNDNNTNTSIINVTLTPPPDLVVNFVNIQSSTFSGENLTYSYQVENNGTGVTTESYWQDYIFISQSDIFDESTAEFLAAKVRNLPLEAGATYTINDSINLPEYIIGDYYIHIITDFNNQVYEFAFEDNNIGISNLVEVFLTPPPDLELEFIIAPDTIYPNQSTSIVYQFSNTGAAEALFPWQDRFYISDDQNDITNAILLNTINNNLDDSNGYMPETEIDRAYDAKIPSNLTNGQYFIYGIADYFNQVFEFDQEDDNNLAVPVILETPDLIPISINSPGSIQSGKTANISYVVRNDNRGKVINRNNQDKIYLSMDTVISDDDVLLSQNNYTLNQNQQSEISKNVSIIIPDGLQDNYYLIVETDANSHIIEPDENNNTASIPVTIELAPYADLAANGTTNLPDTATAMIETLTFNYSVNNEGDAITNSNEWIDKVYVSLNPVFNTDEKFIELASNKRITALNQNETYSNSGEFSFPMVSALLPGRDSATVYIHLFTDVNDEVFEIDAVANNNIYNSKPIYVICPPPVNLNISQMSTLPKDTFLTGEELNLSWSVQNLGNTTALWDYNIWYDGIYLSRDPIWDPDDLFIEDFTQTGPLDSLAYYNDAQNITIPNGISGHFCLMLVLDNQVYLNDNDTINNIGIFPGNMPGPNMYIEQAPSPDLEASNFISPLNGLAGQPIEVIVEVTNVGPTVTSANWNDKVYLSKDFKIDNSDKIISTNVKNNLVLNRGESYLDTLEIILPNDVNENLVILFKTDAGNRIYEDGNEENNVLYNFITITEAPPSDLIVNSANYPDTAFVNQKIDIDYEVSNQGIFPASGIQTDIVYLSVDSILDAGDAIVGFNEITDTILPTESNIRKAAMLCTPGIALGDYHLLVQADALNNIAESSDTNNVYISPTKISISVPELPLNTIVDKTLIHQMSEFYFIQIDDSLKNQTLKITLTSDALEGNNELYLSYEQVPTLANQDYSFEIPFSGNQELLVPELLPGTYYLNVYGQHSNSLTQSATLFAEIIDFEINSITANEGGNTGNVTTLLKGARFTETMNVQLQKADSPAIYAQNIYLNNSTEAYVTFNLNGAEIGMYDVYANKTNGENTLLTNAFEVVEGAAGTFGGADDQLDNGFYCNISNIGTENLLSRNIIHPASVRVGRNVPITIQFGNNGNVDIPAPSRFLISLRGAPLAFEIDELIENKQDLFLEFEEKGGPPGILRPGAVGSITVYSYSSHPLRFLLNE